ncbi:MAG: hypothetical protein HC793_00895, partial [Aquincola sp.]|nr:hypothetical protein [Aquincola sp.]
MARIPCLRGRVPRQLPGVGAESKAETPFQRSPEIFDTTLGWRFVNKEMKEKFGIDAMGETAENVAGEYQVKRADQDAFALRSQLRAV